MVLVLSSHLPRQRCPSGARASHRQDVPPSIPLDRLGFSPRTLSHEHREENMHQHEQDIKWGFEVDRGRVRAHQRLWRFGREAALADHLGGVRGEQPQHH
jgi:hypothetical protein